MIKMITYNQNAKYLFENLNNSNNFFINKFKSFLNLQKKTIYYGNDLIKFEKILQVYRKKIV